MLDQFKMNKIKIAIIVAAPITVRVFLVNQIHALSEIYDVTVIANLTDDASELDNMPDNIQIHSLPIERNIKLFADLKVFIALIIYFWRQKFLLIHSVSPKAGLLATSAGWVARVPNRLHTFTGQVWATSTGFKKWFLKSMDKLIACFASRVLVDSYSQSEFLVENGVLKKSFVDVLGEGSISGVDLQRFSPSVQSRESIRRELNIENNISVILFLGRLKIDKGVLDLAAAFNKVYKDLQNIVLVVIGPDEEFLQSKVLIACGDAASATRFIPFTKQPEDYMAASDIFVLPSYREGFGTVVIEAAACGVPSIVSRIYGLTDAVENEVSGLFFEAGNVADLTTQLKRLLCDHELRVKLANNGLRRVKEKFSQEVITNALCALYADLLSVKSEDEP